MNNDPNTRTNRDQEQATKRAKGGPGPSKHADTEWLGSKQLGEALESRGPTPPPGSGRHASGESRGDDNAARRGEPLPADKISDRSPKQENL